MAVVWLGTAALEAVVLELAWRTDNSWFLLLAAALLLIPLAATDMTVRWLGRPRRKRWKRHDIEAGIAGAPDPGAQPGAVPPAHNP